MALPIAPKKTGKRDQSVSFRLPKDAVEMLAKLKTTTNLSMSQIIEHLIRDAYAETTGKGRKA